MVGKISLWAQGIVIAIIIGTVLQMIIPENKNKKYIKVVIGIYVLFCIINPVVGNSLNLDDYSLEKYVTINETNSDKSQTYESNIKNMFVEKVKSTIQQQLNSQGYDSADIQIAADDDYNIQSIKISSIKEHKKDSSSVVNKIDISIKDKPATGMPISEKMEVKKYIKNTFNVEENNIFIE